MSSRSVFSKLSRDELRSLALTQYGMNFPADMRISAMVEELETQVAMRVSMSPEDIATSDAMQEQADLAAALQGIELEEMQAEQAMLKQAMAGEEDQDEEEGEWVEDDDDDDEEEEEEEQTEFIDSGFVQQSTKSNPFAAAVAPTVLPNPFAAAVAPTVAPNPFAAAVAPTVAPNPFAAAVPVAVSANPKVQLVIPPVTVWRSVPPAGYTYFKVLQEVQTSASQWSRVYPDARFQRGISESKKKV